MLGLVDVDGDAAPVVDDANAAVGQDGDVDVGGIARKRLVDGVVDDLVDEVVQASWTCRADVHARPLANRFETLEYLDVIGAVCTRLLGLRRFRCHGLIGLLTVVLATLDPIKRRSLPSREAPI